MQVSPISHFPVWEGKSGRPSLTHADVLQQCFLALCEFLLNVLKVCSWLWILPYQSWASDHSNVIRAFNRTCLQMPPWTFTANPRKPAWIPAGNMGQWQGLSASLLHHHSSSSIQVQYVCHIWIETGIDQVPTMLSYSSPAFCSYWKGRELVWMRQNLFCKCPWQRSSFSRLQANYCDWILCMITHQVYRLRLFTDPYFL